MEGNTEFDDMDVSEQVIIDDSIDVVNKPNENFIKPSSSKVNSVEKVTEKTEKLSKLPLNRIKNLIKLDPDVGLASQEAVFVLSKATVRIFVCALLTAKTFTNL